MSLSSFHTRQNAKANLENEVRSQEFERLRALYKYRILDTLPEAEYDRLVEVVTEVCRTPVGLIGFIDKDRQWMKANIGYPYQETSRQAAFCHYCIQGGDLMVIPDTHAHPLFQDNPLVTGYPYIRAYLGAPLIDPEGYAVGSLCAIDHEPREFGDLDRKVVRVLSEQVVKNLELRRHNQELRESYEKEMVNKALEAEEEAKERLGRELHDGLTQNLSAASLFLNHLKEMEGAISAEELADWAERIEGPLQEAIREARHVSHDLTLKRLEQGGLSTALAELLAPFDGEQGCLKVHLNDRSSRDGYAKGLEKNLYRAVQEILNNAIKHAEAENLYIDLLEQGGRILLQATDDGMGMDLAQEGRFKGLDGIRGRVDAMDGLLNVESRPGEGASILIEVDALKE